MAKIKKIEMTLEDIKEVVKKIYTNLDSNIEFTKKGQQASQRKYIIAITEDYFIHTTTTHKSSGFNITFYDALLYAEAKYADPISVKICKDRFKTIKDDIELINYKITIAKAKEKLGESRKKEKKYTVVRRDGEN